MKTKRRFLNVAVLLSITMLSTIPASPALAQRAAGLRVPQNMNFTIELLSPISTARNKKGDTFRCLVIAPSAFSEAIVDGELTKLKASGKATGKSEIAMAFRSITMPNGDTGKFDAQIKEVYEVAGAANQSQADEEGRVKAKSYRKRDALGITIAAGIGAAIGGVLGGGSGAALGAAIGAGLAAAGTLTEKGPDLEFSDGTRFIVQTAGR